MTFAAPILPPHSGSEPPASGTTNIPVPSSFSPRHGLDNDSHINLPFWQNSDKRPRYFPISVIVSNINFSNKKPMPISINNSLPSVQLHVGTIASNENKLRMLVDTGATMNTGNKDYHQWVMSLCPIMAAEYLEYDPGTEYDFVQILAV